MKFSYLFLNTCLSVLSMILIGCTYEGENTMVSKEIKEGWTFRKTGDTVWAGATVPGTVHTDLMAQGKIGDPYYRLNEHNVQWIDKTDWEYKTTFIAGKNLTERGNIVLRFKGLDTYAEVYLNGVRILNADNMFREWTADAKPAMKEGDNELRILFRSPVAEGIKKYDAQGYVIPVSGNDLAEIGQVEGGKMVSVYTRKAGYHFGWDWGPRLVTSGIWRPVYLEAWDVAHIQNLQVVQNEVSEKKAVLSANFEIESSVNKSASLQVISEGRVIACGKISLQKGRKVYPVEFAIENPKLWWTNGLGEQNLYEITGKLRAGNIRDELSTRIGIRILELVRDRDPKGTSFYFKLNGHPVFMKGANYIPNDIFLPRTTDENYRKVVATAKNSNMNMLRVWGGGVYEDDRFYDLCDEAGILVWQDFMFACAMFPGDEAFLDNVKQEAIDNVKRLRNHPSIALWCGNNEILAAWYGWGWKKAEEAKNQENADKIWRAYTDIFHKTLPAVVEEFDPQRKYWDSSPSSGLGMPADLKNGDEHYWGVWWGKEPFSTYATHIARFMSEYGFQSFPEISTIRKYALAEDYDIFSEVMKSHQRSSIGNGTILYYMLKEFEKPRDFESFLYVNHVLQAEGIKFGLEGHRRAMPYCMGSLYWQINDCWPVASWSSTDYYQKWKALQYYVMKGFAPLLVSPYFDGLELKVNLINDKRVPVSGKLSLQILDFSGKILRNYETGVEIPGNTNKIAFAENTEKFVAGNDTRKLFLYARLVSGDTVLASNTLYFKPFKELKLPAPSITHSIMKMVDGYEITISTDKLARNVYLQMGDEEGFFSDNYFDMLPGQQVKVHLKSAVSEEKLKEALTFKTLVDAF